MQSIQVPLIGSNPQSNNCCCRLGVGALAITAIIIVSLLASGQFNIAHGNSSSIPSLRPTSFPSKSPTFSPSFRSNYPSLAPTGSFITVSPTIVPTSSENIKQLAEVNDTPYYLQLTSQSSWGNGVSCYSGQEEAPCTSLNSGDEQVIAMTNDASSSAGTGVDYNLCSSFENSNCNGYSGHIHINYNVLNGALTPTLTNNADGTVQIISKPGGYLSIQMAQVPTLAPVTSPPTPLPAPTLNPTSAAPTTSRPSTTFFPTSENNIEKSAWYIDWTTWFNGPPYSIPTGVNLLNVFVGELAYDSNGNPTLDGFGNLNIPQLDAFTEYCRTQNPPIDVKVSVGGGGGSYDNTWDLLTSENTQSFAQGLVDFCHAHGLVGVDFDYEEFKSSEQEALVGTLIKQFKEIDSSLQATLCTNAGFGSSYPWQDVVQRVFDAAIVTPGKCPMDRLYIMSYYNPMEQEQGWVNGWANWLQTRYNCPFSVIGVGIDTFDANAYDPTEFTNWALSMGYSVAHWAYDPAHPTNW